MTSFEQNHFAAWVERQFGSLSDCELYGRMVAIFNQDPKFWADHSYWKLYDAARIDEAFCAGRRQ